MEEGFHEWDGEKNGIERSVGWGWSGKVFLMKTCTLTHPTGALSNRWYPRYSGRAISSAARRLRLWTYDQRRMYRFGSWV